jgi:hypothetical protein
MLQPRIQVGMAGKVIGKFATAHWRYTRPIDTKKEPPYERGLE